MDRGRFVRQGGSEGRVERQGESPSRRDLLRLGVALGATAVACGRWSGEEPLTGAVLREAEKLLDLEFSDAERELMIDDLEELRASYRALREVPLDNGVPPALRFDPFPPSIPEPPSETRAKPWKSDPVEGAAGVEELAFAPVTRLAPLLASGGVSSVDLTRMFLRRMKRLDTQLHAVITLTEDLAMEQAARADEEIAAGRYRGPLHGVPWGAKDLLSCRGYPTTWGAEPFREQILDEDATVVERLGDAGAVLVAKLTLGALAWDDVWFGGKTRNPWNLEQGSSGSSAGPASAVAAGLVPFAIGSETWGSIASPSRRCGVTGLRPTFGRVSRHGAMALSWSMDKLGPMGRSAADCALVLEAISGRDGRDPTAVGEPFRWDAARDPESVRLGWIPELFEAPEDGSEDGQGEDPEAAARTADSRRNDLEALEVLRQTGFAMRPIELPKLPVEPLALILSVEAAAAFDELTRSGRDDLMVRQQRYAWPNVFRHSRLVPAVEYLQANRVRTLLMREMDALFGEIDAYVVPTHGGDSSLLTNLTGHPELILPNGFRSDGTPTSLSFVGRLWGESELVALGRAYQGATDFHRRKPPLG